MISALLVAGSLAIAPPSEPPMELLARSSRVRIEPIDLSQPYLPARGSDSPAAVVGTSRSDSTQLVVPFYIVDTTSPSSVTTLFAVQADIDFDTPLEIRYEDAFGNVFLTETGTIEASSVLTVNVRDKNPPVLNAGVSIGRVVVETSPGFLINGDFYRVDPGDNFAQGGGLISADDQCLIEDVRFGIGGIFDDTIISYHYANLATPAMAGQNAAVVEVYDEAGNLVDAFNLVLPDGFSRVDFFSVTDVLSQLGGGPAFGYFRFFWNPSTVVAAVSFAETSADGRFSVGVQGACRLSVEEAQ